MLFGGKLRKQMLKRCRGYLPDRFQLHVQINTDNSVCVCFDTSQSSSITNVKC